MYLHASLLADPAVADHVDVAIHSFLADTPIIAIIDEVVANQPDLVGFSCQGWNIAVYSQLLPTLRQLLPAAVIVFGGNHVSHQGSRWLSQIPEVDIVVNGEGEHTIRDLAAWMLQSEPPLNQIAGITYRGEHAPVTNDPRPRATALEDLPSPFVSAIDELANADVALWETNRGCPYHCAFCHWGGAVGQKISRGGLDRVREELQTIAKAGTPAIFLCDANFGILPQDLEIARMIVDARQRYGAPRTLHVNWAKNHANRVGQILDVLREGDVRTNVYLALQTLSSSALALAGRDERGRSDMMQLARDILAAGGEVGAELIFGLPGETLNEFRSAYDELYPAFPSLLVHPLWILPNTTYDSERATFGLITIKPDPTVDYEGVLQHATLSRADNQTGLQLLLADDILVGSGYARTTMRGLARWAGIRPTQILHAFLQFISRCSDPLAEQLHVVAEVLEAECYFHRRLRGNVRQSLFSDRARAHALLDEFVKTIAPDPQVKAVCRQLAQHDTALLPRADVVGEGTVTEKLTVPYDTYALGRRLLADADCRFPDHRPVELEIEHQAGFARHAADAIDFSGQWRGRVVATTPVR
jgi:hypothetical protein